MRARKTKSALKNTKAANKLVSTPHRRFTVALLQYQLEQYNDAKKGFEALIADDPEHMDAIAALGQIHIAQENFRVALELLKKCIDLDKPILVMEKDGLHQSTWASRIYEPATLFRRLQFEKALEVNPESSQAKMALAALQESELEADRSSIVFDNSNQVKANPALRESVHGEEEAETGDRREQDPCDDDKRTCIRIQTINSKH